MLLIVFFLVGMLMRLCANHGFCGPMGSPYHISLFCIAWNLILLVFIFCMIVYKALRQSNAATLRLKNGKEPTVTLSSDHDYHTFVSHIWGSGQDQAAVIKRQLLHLMPTAKVQSRVTSP